MSDYLDKDSILKKLREAHQISKNAETRQALLSEIDDHERIAGRKLYVEDPYAKHRKIFDGAQTELKQGKYDVEMIRRDLASFRYLQRDVGGKILNSAYWKKNIKHLQNLEQNNQQSQKSKKSYANTKHKDPAVPNEEKALVAREKLNEEKKILRLYLQEEWGKALDKAQAQWRIDFISELRRKLLEKIENWLKYLQMLADAMRDFAFEPGLLFDLSKDGLTLSDIQKMKEWADYLRDDAEMRRLCELLGRMRRTAQSKRREWIETMEKFTEIRPDVNSRKEYSGIRLGNSIEHALPQEKALLADAETSLLFDIKFVENRLMEFDTTGWVQHEMKRAKKIETEVTEEEKKGPLIVCVDTSGSMHGAPETVAKAVALYLATEAKGQKRNYFLINFSTGIETLDLSRPGSFRHLIQFLQKSFRGGTDVAPALRCAAEKMGTEDYKNADLLAISDFLMDALPEDVPPLIAAAKKNGARFFSLVIGETAGVKAPDFFDRDWRYTPGGGTKELLNISEEAEKAMRRLPNNQEQNDIN